MLGCLGGVGGGGIACIGLDGRAGEFCTFADEFVTCFELLSLLGVFD